MNPIQPRITRRELQQLIRQRAWSRLNIRLAQAHPMDIAAQLPGLQPQQRQTLLQLIAHSSGIGVQAGPGDTGSYTRT